MRPRVLDCSDLVVLHQSIMCVSQALEHKQMACGSKLSFKRFSTLSHRKPSEGLLYFVDIFPILVMALTVTERLYYLWLLVFLCSLNGHSLNKYYSTTLCKNFLLNILLENSHPAPPPWNMVMRRRRSGQVLQSKSHTNGL